MSLVTGEKWRFFLQNVNCFQWMDIPRTHYLNFKPSKQLDEANLELVSPMIKNSFPVNYNHAVM